MYSRRSGSVPRLPLTKTDLSKPPPWASVISGRSIASRRLLVLALLLITVLAYWHADDAFTVHFRDLGYVTRPLWDRAPKHFESVIRLARETDPLWSDSQSGFGDICAAHGLKPLPIGSPTPMVFDAVIFSVELDLLEIRMRELQNVVDKFIVVESNVTFTGVPRSYVYQENEKQFAFAKNKVIYAQVGDLHVRNPRKYEDPFENEGRMRRGVSAVIDRLATPPVGSIILQSDVDEIPSARAVSLLKHCTGWGNNIHLGLPSYLYSFEFPMQRKPADSRQVNNGEGHGTRQSRATAKRYLPGVYSGFTHSRISDSILELAGWHVTFGFRYIEDFIFKMKSYSHNDRVTSPRQLSPEMIQQKICNGQDVFEMLPEAYDFQSLLSQMGPIPHSSSLTGLPAAVLADQNRFDYLLPGGCKREWSQTS